VVAGGATNGLAEEPIEAVPMVGAGELVVAELELATVISDGLF